MSLVVALAGGGVARWNVAADTARLEVFWMSPTEIILGVDQVSPRMRVSWNVASR